MLGGYPFDILRYQISKILMVTPCWVRIQLKYKVFQLLVELQVSKNDKAVNLLSYQLGKKPRPPPV